jgi:hypothetical protein
MRRRRGVTLVCSSGYAATDTWNTRKLRTAQLRLSLLRLNPKKKPLCVWCDIEFACKIAFLNTRSSKIQETVHGKANTSLSSVGDSKLYILQYSGRAELTNLILTQKAGQA